MFRVSSPTLREAILSSQWFIHCSTEGVLLVLLAGLADLGCCTRAGVGGDALADGLAVAVLEDEGADPGTLARRLAALVGRPRAVLLVARVERAFPVAALLAGRILRCLRHAHLRSTRPCTEAASA